MSSRYRYCQKIPSHFFYGWLYVQIVGDILSISIFGLFFSYRQLNLLSPKSKLNWIFFTMYIWSIGMLIFFQFFTFSLVILRFPFLISPNNQRSHSIWTRKPSRRLASHFPPYRRRLLDFLIQIFELGIFNWLQSNSIELNYHFIAKSSIVSKSSAILCPAILWPVAQIHCFFLPVIA